jgi:hypothetical protein
MDKNEHYTIPEDSGMYRALMNHYIHYDRQFWSRTQILLVIQGAGFVSGYNLRFNWLGSIIMFFTAFIVLVIWILIERDISNSRKNQRIMDELSDKIFKNTVKRKRVISLRDDPRFLSGRMCIHIVISILFILNLSLGIIYGNNLKKIRSPFSDNSEKHAYNKNCQIINFNKQLNDSKEKLVFIENDIDSFKNLEKRNAELYIELLEEVKYLNSQLSEFQEK